MAAHWITPNERTIVPRNYVTLDTESRIERRGRRERQTFRCASTAWDRQSTKTGRWMETVWRDYDSPAELWREVDGYVRTGERMVIVSHNAPYDIRISDALTQLALLDWQLEAITLQGRGAWAAWRRGKQRIVWVDSLSWLPHSLAKIGDAIGLKKRPLPAGDDCDDAWRDRCRDDVAILRDAWLRIVRWLIAGGHGNWRPTGAGQAWQSYRHNHYTDRILIHDDDGARVAERRAAWTGRAEAWRHGRLNRGPYSEYDFSAAYARIALTHEVPARLIGEHAVYNGRRHSLPTRGVAALCECTVTTDAPTVPTLLDGRVVWPVGTFDTTLWSNELGLALDHGARVTVHREWLYRTAPALRKWAEWVLSIVDAPHGSVDPIIRMVAKHWSRALIGRFGSRYSTWELFGESPTDDVALGWCNGLHDDGPRRMLHVGGRALIASGEVEGRDAAPQVMGWVMAQARVNLWHTMQLAGIEHVVYVDTDSVIVDADGAARLDAAQIPGLVCKARWPRIEVIGTRRLVLDGELRAAGVPRNAVRTGERSWTGEAFSQLASSLASGDVAAVNVVERTVRLRERDVRRRQIEGGWTAPYEAGHSSAQDRPGLAAG